MLAHEEIEITRNYRQEIQDSWLCPYRAITHYKNHQLLEKLSKSTFYSDLHEKQVKAIITVGNFSLMNRLYGNITDDFAEKRALMPLRLFFDQLVAYRDVGSEDYLDYIYYNLPKLPENQSRYVFPSMCIGYEGLFRAFQFLQKYRNDPQNSSFLSKEFSIEYPLKLL